MGADADCSVASMRGNVMRKVDPRFGVLSALTDPPCATTIRFTFRHPRPAAEVFADVRGRVVYREDVLTPTTDEWPET